VSGFQPIFNADIQLTVKPGPCLILGGNGLGKTTLMQALVYGLSGGVPEAIEEDRKMRWGHAYFRSRLDPDSGKIATVEVSFRLGKEKIAVRRGLAGSHVVAVRVGPTTSRWIEGDAADGAYEEALRIHGGYETAADFAFVVNRLLYLPENRTLLAWDTDAQTRILMLVNRDVSTEGYFRERRKQLKLWDSRKRHIHVELGKAEKALSSLDEDTTDEPEETNHGALGELDAARLPGLVEKLNEATKARIAAARNLAEIERTITSISSEVETLHLAIEVVEGSLVTNLLDSTEREKNLAIHKLLESAVCPSCGTQQRDLQATAQQYYKEHKCCICGSDQPQITNPDLVSMRSRLAERMDALHANEQAYAVLEQRVSSAREAEATLLAYVNQIRFAQPVLDIPDDTLSVSTRQDLSRRKKKLARDEADLAIQIRELQSNLEKEYQEFLNAMEGRLSLLRRTYEEYASEFLGVTCKLAAAEQADRLLALTAFIPEFGGSQRRDPQSCSEAQRFFLDIAFRMAIVDAASDMADSPSCFICETPENALDVSYVDNVVQMFLRFMSRQHTLVFSANLQDSGIAQKIMASVPTKEDRRSRVVNLLDFGQLTNVHNKALSRLKYLANKVMG
jgi:hypothetical protein